MPEVAVDDAANDNTFPLECLLQELLMALVGYTGDVFTDSSSSSEG